MRVRTETGTNMKETRCLRGEHENREKEEEEQTHLNGNDEVASVLEEVLGIDADNTGLVGLGNIGEDGVNHGHEHAVLERVSGILNNRDDVGSLLGSVDQITARTVGELDGVDHACWLGREKRRRGR